MFDEVIGLSQSSGQGDGVSLVADEIDRELDVDDGDVDEHSL